MPLKAGDLAPIFEASDQNDERINVPKDFQDKYVALVFLRYLGCPLCLVKMDEIKEKIGRFKDKNVEVIVVLQSTAKRIKSFAQKQGMPFHMISDRQRSIYSLYEVEKGGLKEFLAPNVLKNTVKATLKGKMHGAFEGDEMQVPADFLIGPDGNILYAYYGKDISDFSPVEDILEAVK